MRDADPPKDRLIFLQAQRFHSASRRLAEGSFETAARHALPCLFVSHAASELYLKLLNFRHSGMTMTGHNLLKLYANLPGPLREDIRRRWSNMQPKLPVLPPEVTRGLTIPITLEEQLAAASKAYTSSRYFWERTGDEVVMTQHLPDILRAVTVERYPDLVT
jgi:HEPN domain-containing protein